MPRSSILTARSLVPLAPTPKGFAVSTVATERVLVVPTSLFQELGYFQGFSTEVAPLPAAAPRRRPN